MMVGPEAPSYIEVPQSIQPDLPRRPQLKGTLPVPRELFPANRPDKPTESYISDAAPLPSNTTLKVSPDHPQYERLQWKQKMAENRRKNLREGLLELHERKKNSHRRMVARSNTRENLRTQIMNQPPRKDELLTAPTTVSAMKPTKCKVLPNPGAEERLAQSIVKVQEAQAAKREDMMNSLHELYVNAQKFIVNEEQLKAELERVFPDKNNPDWANGRRAGDSIWNLGPPPTMSSLAYQTKDELTKWETVQRRTKRLAEELTGGKI
ncbi:uncharacterized protein GIQ15_03202 [Arthroderma uncinatum]|uniref:uncharacterized protein n=1 Tax=Arthroderma uncinatum TaxID=74035 RepID=UPI00144AE6D0|nr:uncharacterized protein GIQ15_03202 [Arthroderma uncinatum]KAF3483878.1 hypothetical protein GIQ15_03202 [Arthroderma uncinatum]